MALLDFLNEILPPPLQDRRRPSDECGVNVTVCDWDDDTWAENAEVISAISHAVSGSFSLCMSTVEMEDDLQAAYGHLFAEVSIEKIGDAEFQVTLVTHECAAADAD